MALEAMLIGIVNYTHKIAGMLMSINAMKAIEFGNLNVIKNNTGSMVHDQMFNKDGKIKRRTNNSGGIEGGI